MKTVKHDLYLKIYKHKMSKLKKKNGTCHMLSVQAYHSFN